MNFAEEIYFLAFVTILYMLYVLHNIFLTNKYVEQLFIACVYLSILKNRFTSTPAVVRIPYDIRYASKSHAPEHSISESQQQQRINQNTNLFNLFKFEVNRKRKIANISQNKSRARHLATATTTISNMWVLPDCLKGRNNNSSSKHCNALAFGGWARRCWWGVLALRMRSCCIINSLKALCFVCMCKWN